MTPNEVNAVSLIFWNVAGAAPVLALLAVVVEPTVTWRLSAPAVASILYLGVLAAGVGFVGFVWLTRTYAATRRGIGYGAPGCWCARDRIRYLDREHGELM